VLAVGATDIGDQAEPLGPKVIFGNGMVRADSAVHAAE
jgi:hypothetical protein